MRPIDFNTKTLTTSACKTSPEEAHQLWAEIYEGEKTKVLRAGKTIEKRTKSKSTDGLYLSFKDSSKISREQYADELRERVRPYVEAGELTTFDPEEPLRGMNIREALHSVTYKRLTAQYLADLTCIPRASIEKYLSPSKAKPMYLKAFAALIDGLAYQNQDGNFTDERTSVLYHLLGLEDLANDRAREELEEAEYALGQRKTKSLYIALRASTLSDKELNLLYEIAQRLDTSARMPKTIYHRQLTQDMDEYRYGLVEAARKGTKAPEAPNKADYAISPTDFEERAHKALRQADLATMQLLLDSLTQSLNV